MSGSKEKTVLSHPQGIEGLVLFCNTPNCPTKEEGCSIMEHPGTNKSVFKCPDCGCQVVVGMEE